MRLCSAGYALVLVDWVAHDSSVRLLYSRSRLLVTGKGFLFVEGCGKVLVQAVAGPTLRNREGLAGLELRAKLVRC